MEAKASSFDSAAYWLSHERQPAVMAYRAIAENAPSTSPKPVHNMYEGSKEARQLSETVSEFLKRLPPSSIPLAEYGPWIWIANPTHRDEPTKRDLRGFGQRGKELLEDFDRVRAGIETSMAGKTKSVIGRKLTPLRKKLEQDIYALAREKGITYGKWMLFPPPDDVNRIWGLVAQAVADGELGSAAKVATDDGSGTRGARLICVYNEDFANKVEVKRVLKRLDELGLVREGGSIADNKSIYYKADAYTHLDIMGGNAWGLRASLYSSKDVFDERWLL